MKDVHLCDSCGRDGFYTPAKHSFGGLHLCQRCTRDADSFAGYATWTPAMKAKRHRILANDAPHGPVTHDQGEEASGVPFDPIDALWTT